MVSNNKLKCYLDFIHFPVYSLGPGKRIGIFFQGCEFNCLGCIASHTHIQERKNEITLDNIYLKIKKSLKLGAEGVTFSGGEPFLQFQALENIIDFCIKLGLKDILIYSGYKYQYLIKNHKSILFKSTCLIDGKFKKELLSNHHWKGSNNQQLYFFSNNKILFKKYLNYINTKKSDIQVISSKDRIITIGIPQNNSFKEIKSEIL